MEGTHNVTTSQSAPLTVPLVALGSVEQIMSGKKILIVDDSVVILKVLSLKLKTSGYEVLTATDGGSAVSLARQHKPDLIILDINFPPDVAHGGGVPWDAFTIMTWMRRIEGLEQIPVIIITSGDPAKYRDRSFSAGAVGFFVKPIDNDQLLAKVREVLGTPA